MKKTLRGLYFRHLHPSVLEQLSTDIENPDHFGIGQ
jgi:hypothetical protein